MKEKVVHNNSQVKFKKTEVEDHHRYRSFWKYLGTVRFGNDQFALILGYGDLVQGNIMINKDYYIEGLNHYLFSVGQFYDADLEVAFRKSTCFVRDLQGNHLLIGTNNARIIRKRSKPDKHEHGNKKSAQELGVSSK
ncbi:hypothetical protein Tco_0057445, partial [Tanacetum coccineum]